MIEEYSVSWTIDVSGESPLRAAEEARAAQTDPDTTATFFVVTDREGNSSIVDTDTGAVNPYTTVEATVIAALNVLVHNPKIRAYLEANDPKALKQARKALHFAAENQSFNHD